MQYLEKLRAECHPAATLSEMLRVFPKAGEQSASQQRVTASIMLAVFIVLDYGASLLTQQRVCHGLKTFRMIWELGLSR